MTILPHNIVNDAPWLHTGYEWQVTVSRVPVRLQRRSPEYRVHAPILGVVDFEASNLPAAKVEALRLVREAILAEAEAWK